MVKMHNLHRHRKTGVWYFRMVIPKDVRKLLGRAEVMVSLGTKDEIEAIKRAIPHVERWKATIADARAGRVRRMSDEQLQTLAIAWGHDYQSRLVWGVTKFPDEIGLPIASEDELDERLTQYLREEEIPIEFGSPDYAVLRQMAFDEHKYSYAVRPVLGGLAPVTAPVPESKVPGLELSKVFARFLTEVPSSSPDRRVAVDRFIEFFGDKPITAITRADARKFCDTSRKIPRAMPGTIREKPLRDQIAWAEANKAERIGPSSVNKHLSMIGSLLDWVHNHTELLDHLPDWRNPFDGINVHDSRTQDDKRVAYSPGDLEKIFSSTFMRRPQFPEDYWLPVLAIFTGARMEELGQLDVADVRREGKVDFLALTEFDTAGRRTKKLKNKSSERDIPIHPRLIELGFLRYVEERRRAGDAKVFPRLRADIRGKLTHNANTRINRALADIIPDKRKRFHSFRHAFKSELVRRLITEQRQKLLMGHGRGNVGDTVYIHKETLLEVLQSDIRKIFPDLKIAQAPKFGEVSATA